MPPAAPHDAAALIVKGPTAMLNFSEMACAAAMEPPPVPGASPAAVAALPTLVPAPLVAGQEEDDELEAILELPPLDELGAISSSRRSAGSFENSGRTTTTAGQSVGALMRNL